MDVKCRKVWEERLIVKMSSACRSWTGERSKGGRRECGVVSKRIMWRV